MTKDIKNLVEQIVAREISLIHEQVDGTMKFWHGGDLSSANMDNSHEFSQKKGRYEFGPGLYLTSHYDTAKKYAKGSRKLYIVTVEPGNDLRQTFIDRSVIDDFINVFAKPKLKEELGDLLDQRMDKGSGKVRASVFGNIILNLDALPPSKTGALRQFYIDNGIDYELVSSAFGWGEKMLVLYNMKKITNVKEVNSNDPENNNDFH